MHLLIYIISLIVSYAYLTKAYNEPEGRYFRGKRREILDIIFFALPIVNTIYAVMMIMGYWKNPDKDF